MKCFAFDTQTVIAISEQSTDSEYEVFRRDVGPRPFEHSSDLSKNFAISVRKVRIDSDVDNAVSVNLWHLSPPEVGIRSEFPLNIGALFSFAEFDELDWNLADVMALSQLGLDSLKVWLPDEIVRAEAHRVNTRKRTQIWKSAPESLRALHLLRESNPSKQRIPELPADSEEFKNGLAFAVWTLTFGVGKSHGSNSGAAKWVVTGCDPKYRIAHGIAMMRLAGREATSIVSFISIPPRSSSVEFRKRSSDRYDLYYDERFPTDAGRLPGTWKDLPAYRTDDVPDGARPKEWRFVLDLVEAYFDEPKAKVSSTKARQAAEIALIATGVSPNLASQLALEEVSADPAKPLHKAYEISSDPDKWISAPPKKSIQEVLEVLAVLETADLTDFEERAIELVGAVWDQREDNFWVELRDVKRSGINDALLFEKLLQRHILQYDLVSLESGTLPEYVRDTIMNKLTDSIAHGTSDGIEIILYGFENRTAITRIMLEWLEDQFDHEDRSDEEQFRHEQIVGGVVRHISIVARDANHDKKPVDDIATTIILMYCTKLIKRAISVQRSRDFRGRQKATFTEASKYLKDVAKPYWAAIFDGKG